MQLCHEGDGTVLVFPRGVTAEHAMQGSSAFRAIGHLNDRSMRLLHVFVEPAHRNRGICTRMILMLATEARSRQIRRLDLDDMSDAYRQSRNVYVQCGFRYLKKDGCEMTATPRHVIVMANKKLETLETTNAAEVRRD